MFAIRRDSFEICLRFFIILQRFGRDSIGFLAMLRSFIRLLLLIILLILGCCLRSSPRVSVRGMSNMDNIFTVRFWQSYFAITAKGEFLCLACFGNISLKIYIIKKIISAKFSRCFYIFVDLL